MSKKHLATESTTREKEPLFLFKMMDFKHKKNRSIITRYYILMRIICITIH